MYKVLCLSEKCVFVQKFSTVFFSFVFSKIRLGWRNTESYLLYSCYSTIYFFFTVCQVCVFKQLFLNNWTHFAHLTTIGQKEINYILTTIRHSGNNTSGLVWCSSIMSGWQYAIPQWFVFFNYHFCCTRNDSPVQWKNLSWFYQVANSHAALHCGKVCLYGCILLQNERWLGSARTVLLNSNCCPM